MKRPSTKSLRPLAMLGLALALHVSVVGTSHSQTPTASASVTERGDEEISINLPEQVTLEQLIDIIARETQTLFIYEKPAIQGSLSITMPANFKVQKKDIFVIFEKLLTTQGLTLVRQKDSNVVELISGAEARFQKLPLQLDGGSIEVTPTDYVMRLRQIKHADLNKIVEAIQPFFSQTGTLLTYDFLSLLIMIDSQANIARISEILDVLDVDEPDELRQVMTIYEMKHTQAAETYEMVSAIYANILQNGRQEAVELIVNSRQNSLIILAPQAATEEILQLLELVDVEVQNEVGNRLTIQPLKFATPGSVAPLLNQIYAQEETPPRPSLPLQNEPQNGLEATTPPALAASAPVKIIPFDNLNALIIIANPATTQDIVALVEQLDVEQGEFQLVFHPLQFASATVLGALLADIFSDQIVAGTGKGETAAKSRIKIIPEPRLNALILIADPFTTERILRLIHQLDVGDGGAEFTVHALQHATAQQTAEVLNAIFTQNTTDQEEKTPQTLLIVPDERLNVLIIFADKIHTQKTVKLIEQLDVPTKEDRARSQFRLYRLQHAVAKDIATLLKEVTGNIVEVAQSEAAASSSENANPAAGASPSPPPLSRSPVGQDSASRVAITVDETTNTVLAFGPREIFATLDAIIEELDIPRVQVYIEALIVETSLSKSLDFGVDWSFAGETQDGNSIVSGGFPGAGPLTAENAVKKAGENTLGIVSGEQLTFGGQNFLSFGAFVRALQKDTDVNILANPQLLMLNSEEASLNVSRVVPVAINSVVDSNGRITERIEFRDVGVIASIRPQINGDNSIRLEISQTSSDLTPTAVGNSNAVTTFKRELKTSVITASDSIVVLGGLLNEKLKQEESKIPGLGDLPLIGWFFGDSNETVDKTNLMMFIRPTIIRNQEDLIKVTTRANAGYQRNNQQAPAAPELLEGIQKGHSEQPKQ